MSEQKKEELLDSTENDKKNEVKEEPKGQFTTLSLSLMVMVVLCILATGCWYTYYQYKRMGEINAAK